MTRARDTADTQDNVGGSVPPFAAGKNRIINGDFSINQRSFSSTTTDNTFGFDRWVWSFSGGTCTYSAQTFTPGTAPVSGYEARNFARIVTSGQTTGSQYAGFLQKIEGVTTFAGQTATFSLWAKAASGTPKIGISLEQNFGTSGSATVITNIAAQTISTSWARYSFTVAVPSISGKTIGTANDRLNVWIWTSCNLSGYATDVGIQNATIDIWGVQAEAGRVATPFQTATGTIQGELAACQRYFQRVGTGAGYIPICVGQCTSTTTVYGIYPLKVTMRATPVVTISTTTGGSVVTASRSFNQSSTWGTNVITSDNIEFLMTIGSGLVAGNASEMWAYTGYADISAEL